MILYLFITDYHRYNFIILLYNNNGSLCINNWIIVIVLEYIHVHVHVYKCTCMYIIYKKSLPLRKNLTTPVLTSDGCGTCRIHAHIVIYLISVRVLHAPPPQPCGYIKRNPTTTTATTSKNKIIRLPPPPLPPPHCRRPNPVHTNEACGHPYTP